VGKKRSIGFKNHIFAAAGRGAARCRARKLPHGGSYFDIASSVLTGAVVYRYRDILFSLLRRDSVNSAFRFTHAAAMLGGTKRNSGWDRSCFSREI